MTGTHIRSPAARAPRAIGSRSRRSHPASRKRSRSPCVSPRTARPPACANGATARVSRGMLRGVDVTEPRTFEDQAFHPAPREVGDRALEAPDRHVLHPAAQRIGASARRPASSSSSTRADAP